MGAAPGRHRGGTLVAPDPHGERIANVERYPAERAEKERPSMRQCPLQIWLSVLGFWLFRYRGEAGHEAAPLAEIER